MNSVEITCFVSFFKLFLAFVSHAGFFVFFCPYFLFDILIDCSACCRVLLMQFNTLNDILRKHGIQEREGAESGGVAGMPPTAVGTAMGVLAF